MKLFKRSVFFVLFSLSPLAFAEVAIIVNSGNSSEISDNDIKRMFLGKNKTFSNGESVKAINLKSGNAIRKNFEKEVLGKSSSQVKAY